MAVAVSTVFEASGVPTARAQRPRLAAARCPADRDAVSLQQHAATEVGS